MCVGEPRLSVPLSLGWSVDQISRELHIGYARCACRHREQSSEVRQRAGRERMIPTTDHLAPVQYLSVQDSVSYPHTTQAVCSPT